MFKLIRTARTAGIVGLMIASASYYAAPSSAITPAQHSYSKNETPPSVVLKAGSAPDAERLLEPLASGWVVAPATNVPLYAQHVAQPIGGGSTKEVSVKAIKTPQGLIFRLDWSDSSRDDGTSDSTFRDGAAIQFPAGSNNTSKALTMGHYDNPVDIWFWSADAERKKRSAGAAMPYRQLSGSAPDMVSLMESNRLSRTAPKTEPSTAKNESWKELVATGVYTQLMKPTEFQQLKGKAVWQSNRWYVTFFRPFIQSSDIGPDFGQKQVAIAFAIWNGGAGERLGMKSVSTWAALTLP